MVPENEFTRLYAPPSYLNNDGTLANIDSDTLDWLNSKFNKSKAFLRSQRGWKIADICMSYLYGDDNSKIPSGISRVQFKKLRRQLKEMIAYATNIRPEFDIQTFKDKFKEEAIIYSKLNKHWWVQNFIDKKIKAVGQWAGGAGTGYLFLWPETNPNTGEVEIDIKVLSHKDFLPHHASSDNLNLDTLYGATVKIEMSVPEAHEKFPEHISIIKQDRNAPSKIYKSAQKVYRTYRGVYDRFKGNKRQVENAYPTCDIFYTFVRDSSINTTGMDIILGGDSPEGIHNSDWAYVVKSYYNVDGSRSIYSRQECKLFPNRRLIVSTSQGIIYDGPPNWVNRQLPIADFRFDEIVGEFLGLPPGNDARLLEESANDLARACVDAVTGRVQPPMGIDDSIPKPLASKLAANPRTLQGKIFRYSMKLLGNIPLKPLIPAEYYQVDGKAMELIAMFQQMSDYNVGTHDLTAITQLAQMPGADTQEAMIRALGALALDYSRSFEYSLGRMGRIWLDFAPQVYTTEKRLRFLGKDGVTMDQCDYDPKLLIPKTETNYALPMWQRLRDHLNKFSLYIAPNSLQERMSQTNRLTLLQLSKMGLPISYQRIYETFFDDGRFNETKAQYYVEQQEKIEMAAKLNAEMQKIQEASQPQNQLVEQLKAAIGSQNKNEGRPNENSAPPKLEQKMDENQVPRTTVSTS